MASRGGFTLVELLLVALIMGIVAMMVGPSTHAVLLETQLNGTADEVVSALEYARSCAVLYQRPFAVQWIPQRSVIGVCDRRFVADSEAHLNEDPPVTTFGMVFNPFDKKPYALVLAGGADAGGVYLMQPPEDVLFIFYPEGHVSASSATVAVALGDLQRTITVSVFTGRVVVD